MGRSRPDTRGFDDAGFRQGLLGIPLAAGGRAGIRASGPSEPISRTPDRQPDSRHGARCRLCEGGRKQSGLLATKAWHVTAAEISTEALSRASERAMGSCAAPERVQWIEADLSAWEPGKQFDLVTTHYAHPAMPQLAYYGRISGWVAPGGTLLIVGHRHTSETPGHGHSQEQRVPGGNPPEEVSVTAASITKGLDATRWDIVTADEPIRTLTEGAGRTVQLNDVVVRATRRPRPTDLARRVRRTELSGGAPPPGRCIPSAVTGPVAGRANAGAGLVRGPRWPDDPCGHRRPAADPGGRCGPGPAGTGRRRRGGDRARTGRGTDRVPRADGRPASARPAGGLCRLGAYGHLGAR